VRVPARACGFVFLVALLCAFPATALASSPLSLSASPEVLSHGGPAALTGNAVGVPAGSEIDLDDSPYPYTAKTKLATTVTDAQGNFSFKVFPNRNTRYVAIVVSTGTEATVQVEVEAKTVIRARALTLGRAMVTVLVFHPRDLRWNGTRARWSLKAPGRSLTVAGRTQRLSRYVTQLRLIVPLPAGHFRWKVCFRPPEAGALFDPRRPRGCSGVGYYGKGYLPSGFPGPRAIARAEAYLAGRGGRTALAVVDTEGRLSGANLHSQFITGSVVKAMLLVAYLRRLHDMGQHTVDPYSNSILYPMINVSDNNAATRCWSIVGDSGLYGVAGAARMTEFSVTTDWGSAMISAADQAKFFFEMDSLIPHEFVGYARFLLSTIAGYESWGIPAIARPLGYQVFFKGGWRPSPNIYLVHQIARLEGHGRTFSIAVMTDGDAGMGYGITTIEGATQALIG
jgi:hypothetical protein